MNDTVHTFDPSTRIVPNEAHLARLHTASGQIDAPNFGLSEREVAKFAPLMRCALSEWKALTRGLDDARLVDLVRFFTLAEALPGWQARERSPVIAFMAELRSRKAVPDDLGAWIRAHSDNRFLPWGSLLDRL